MVRWISCLNHGKISKKKLKICTESGLDSQNKPKEEGWNEFVRRKNDCSISNAYQTKRFGLNFEKVDHLQA